MGDPATVAYSFRVLGVDDANDLCALRKLFTEQGSIFIEAGSAEEGLEIMQLGAGFDIVISNYRLLSMNGIDFLSFVSDLQPESLRILLSDQASQLAIMDTFEFHIANLLISKPWNNDELITLIDACSSQKL